MVKPALPYCTLSSRKILVGVERFELPTHCSQSSCATRLRYTPPDPDKAPNHTLKPAGRQFGRRLFAAPARAIGAVLDFDTGGGQLLAQAIGRGPVLLPARLQALLDQHIDFGVGQSLLLPGPGF